MGRRGPKLTGGVFHRGWHFRALCLRRPNPWPQTFGHHEFFHAFTAAAAICHYIAIWLVLF